MKKAILLFTIILFTSTASAEESFEYFSPGIALGYQFDRGFTFGLKISYGQFFNDKYVNLTAGFNILLKKDIRLPYESHQFFEIQSGKYVDFINYNGIMPGGGIGIITYREKGEVKIAPKFSLSAGFIGFITYDHIFIPKIEPVMNLGIQAVCPIPGRGFRL